MQKQLKTEIIEALKEVYDPEIPINVYDLGLIYKISVDSENNVHILMSLTSPTCPTADYIKEMISQAAEGILGVKDVSIELTFDPRWTPERVSEYAKEELGLGNSVIPNNLPVQQVFNGDQTEDEKICFNCAVSQQKKPLLQAHYKKEKVLVCFSCLQKCN